MRTPRLSSPAVGWLFALGLTLGLVVLAACAQPDLKALPLGPDGQPDPELMLGQDVWVQRCTTCHGVNGNGGTGPKLADGKVSEKYPEFSVQVSIIQNGVGGRMPGFGEKLTTEEIEAVALYTRDVL